MSESPRNAAPRRLLVAMSGGVDSSVAAGLLAEQGHELVGVFMRNGVEGAAGERSCCSLSDARDARGVARRLGVRFYVHDLARSFATLIDAFARDYAQGLTPNPCVVCNNDLKFGELDELARDLGCDGVVTGHYARLEGGRLRRAVDPAKDQSYLLHGLTAEQRARAHFPLGGMLKPEVREHARRLGLPVADKKDSSDICFVPGGDYRAVLRERLGHEGTAGELVDETGAVRARHPGVGGFTVGQRRGLGVALGSPRFVTAVEPETGRVSVGPREALRRDGCSLRDVLWHAEPPVDAELLVQLRHHHRPERARVTPLADGRAALRFLAPSEDVTPGQYAVLYDGDTVVGGGRIEAPRVAQTSALEDVGPGADDPASVAPA